MANLLRFLRSLFHWVLAFIFGVFHRILRTLWMRTPPAFLKDWPQQLPAWPPGVPKPPEFDLTVVRGTLNGILLRFTIDSGQLAPLLPKGVMLPLGASNPNYQHPINFAFGFQEDVHPCGLGFLPGSNYLEFVIGVPNLYLDPPTKNGFRGPVAVLARLNLNQILPVILGIAIGLPKRLSRVHTTPSTFQIRRLIESTEVSAGIIEGVYPKVNVDRSIVYQNYKDTFAQPCVTRDIFGNLVMINFHWYFEAAVAEEIHADLIIQTGIGKGTYKYTASSEIVGAQTAGAWRVRVPWIMHFPVRASNWTPLLPLSPPKSESTSAAV